MHYWACLQSVHGFRCYDNIVPNAKCQRVLVLALWLVNLQYLSGISPVAYWFLLSPHAEICRLLFSLLSPHGNAETTSKSTKFESRCLIDGVLRTGRNLAQSERRPCCIPAPRPHGSPCGAKVLKGVKIVTVFSYIGQPRRWNVAWLGVWPIDTYSWIWWTLAYFSGEKYSAADIWHPVCRSETKFDSIRGTGA